MLGHRHWKVAWLARRRTVVPALVFAFFEAIMPLIGLFLGHFVGARFDTPAVFAGGIVLLGVAAYMFKEALEDEDETENLGNPNVCGTSRQLIWQPSALRRCSPESAGPTDRSEHG